MPKASQFQLKPRFLSYYSSMDWTWTTILAISTLIFFLFQELARKKWTKNKRLLPPGPRGLPIIGNLLMIGDKPHRALQQLARKYGPIMHLRFGSVPVIVASSPEAAELFLKTHDLVFASRPPIEAAKYVSYNQQNVSSSPYGSYWRNMRKMCTLELLSNLKINSFKSMRKEELQLFVERIRESAASSADRTAVDLSAKISSLSSDMSFKMVLGKKYFDDEVGDCVSERSFKSVIRESMQIGATFNLADFIPQIKSLDLQGLTKRLKVIAKVFDEFLEKIIDEHVKLRDENRNKDFVDFMLGFMGSEETGYRVERDSIKAIILDILVASMDTTASTIEWTISELIKHPRVMIEVQKELENVVGKRRMVEESDLEKLEYLNMVVKESLRLHPVVPLLIPHASMEDCIVNGYHIPKNSRIFINTWTICRDKNVWTNAERFIPERFVGSDIDLRGHNFELTPFGSGRRSCPGMQLGLTIVRLVVAQLVHCFDWELPDGMPACELDMTEDFGKVCPRAKPLLVIPTWRLET